MKTRFLELILLLCVCSFKNKEMVHNRIEQSSFVKAKICSNLRMSNQIWDFKIIDKKPQYKRSELWNEFEPNSIEGAPIPDSIEVHTFLQNINALLSENDDEFIKQTPDIYVSSKMQLRFSLSTDCMYSINPKLSKEYVLINKRLIKPKEFIESKGKRDSLGYSFTIDFKKLFAIRKLIKENGGELYDESKEDNGGAKEEDKERYYLSQIIIKNRIESTDGKKKCSIEYIHPICIKYEAIKKGF